MKITDNEIKEKLLSVGVPYDLIMEALDSFSRAKKLNSKTIGFTLFASEAALVITPFLKWNAEKLPKFARIFDNDVSINGDRAEWVRNTDGSYTRLPVPLDKDVLTHADGSRFNYYMNLFKKWHARSNVARYVWLGFRNRASWINAKLGVYVKPEKSEGGKVYYNQVWSNRNEEGFGIEVTRYNGEWELNEIQPFMKKFTKRNVLGYKFSNVDEIKRLASVVWTVGAIRS